MSAAQDDSTNGGKKRTRRGNGEGTVLKIGKRWVARGFFDTPDGRKRRSFSGKTRLEATNKLAEARLETIDVELPGPRKPCDKVYFIQAVHGGPVKIGMASDVEKRLQSIQTGSPYELCVLHIVKRAGSEVECEIHRRFSEFRLKGEWFEDAPELLDFIDRLKGRSRYQ